MSDEIGSEFSDNYRVVVTSANFSESDYEKKE